MGSCVSTHQKPPPSSSSMEVQVLFGSSNGDLPAKSLPSFPDFGSKDETFFDSQAWLDSDCDDDFMSVNGEFTPSRGNTPVHHNFSAGNKKSPIPTPYEQSPNGSEKKMRLSDLFNDSQRVNYDSKLDQVAEPINKKGLNPKVESPLVHGTGNGLKTKRERFGRSVQNCFPSLVSSRSSSTNGRKVVSPGTGLGLGPTPNPVVG